MKSEPWKAGRGSPKKTHFRGLFSRLESSCAVQVNLDLQTVICQVPSVSRESGQEQSSNSQQTRL